MSSEGSDIELPSAIPKKINKKMPKSPSEDLLKKKTVVITKEVKKTEDPKKLSTKMMIYQALIDLNTRKGVSLYAIKKYMTEKYNVDTEKLNYLIKKGIKAAVEEGTVVQTKGIGASGSFKLVPKKEKKLKPKKTKKEKESTEKSKNPDKLKKLKEKTKKTTDKIKSKKENKMEEKTGKTMKKVVKDKIPKDKKVGEEKGKPKKVKIAKGLQTPSKKKALMKKRKSIGSIIKPPKMKPKA